jgi:hypothetical protein
MAFSLFSRILPERKSQRLWSIVTVAPKGHSRKELSATGEHNKALVTIVHRPEPRGRC